MHRLLNIIVFLAVMLSAETHAQPAISLFPVTNNVRINNSLFSNQSLIFNNQVVINPAFYFSPVLPAFPLSQLLPSGLYGKNLAFFCRQELQFEKATKIRLRFRLGSLAYCNMLEGKR